jgi:hypothetical protein
MERGDDISVESICGFLDERAQEIPRIARTLQQMTSGPFPYNKARASILEAKMYFLAEQCCYAFNELRKKAHDDPRWQQYNERFDDILRQYCPKALDRIELRHAA